MTGTNLDSQAALETLYQNLSSYLSDHQIDDPAIIGIHSGGVWVAEALAHSIKPESPIGILDISFYRDDFSKVGFNPEVRPSQIPFDVDDRHIVLVDDVLFTGRTIRAALNEIFDYGRPASVTLAILVERDGRQLPIAADCVGLKISLSSNQQIKLSGPEPLALEIVELP